MGKYILFPYVLACIFSCQSNVESNNIDQQNIQNGLDGMVLIPSGTLFMGGNNEQAEADEFPNRMLEIPAFYLDKYEVSNRDFAQFVKATGYLTIAEQDIDWYEMKKSLPPETSKPPEEILKAGSLVFSKTQTPVNLNRSDQWWTWTIGANWKNPYGPGSSIDSLMDHPVVHIAWDDAVAYAEWLGKRLPSEAEWEWAARGGKERKIYPWGNDDINNDPSLANFWQGIFPFKNTLKDGYEKTAPVGKFPANDYGLFDMAGNVWEWCSDLYHHEAYSRAINILGPSESFDPLEPEATKRVMRGGSFLCNDDYCSGYRNARRMKSTMDSGFSHTGFRCAKSIN